MKYFPIERIKEAIDHLAEFEGKWLIPTLVFACNGVNPHAMTNVRQRNGTDSFLDNYFSGGLIGLGPLKSGANSLRPKLADLKRTFSMEGKENDYVIHQDTKLWANAYSRAGYSVMKDRGHVIAGALSEFQLAPSFQSFFETAVPASFHMEELLVWLYAFSGVDDNVNSWQQLLTVFQEQHLGTGNTFDAAYTGRFKISTSPAVPFPTHFLTTRPTNEDFQKELMPSSFVMSMTPQDFLGIRESLLERFRENFQGYSENEAKRLCSDIVSSLAATKRIFLLGEPGIGKTKLARLITMAFRDVFGDDRIFYADEPITDKTTPESLIGYGGITGEWIHGSLTALNVGGSTLLSAESEMNNPNKRNQVNVVLLDECNRRNIEALLARFQNSMDSQSLDPRDSSHAVSLDASGTHFLSPSTFWILTGNSPLNDQGRVPQSRPFKRRPNLVVVPNVIERLIAESSTDELAKLLKKFWVDHCQLGLVIDSAVSQQFADHIENSTDFVADLKALFVTLSAYEIGLSFGLVEKLFRTSSSFLSLGYSFQESIDSGLSTALSPLLSTEKLVDEKSLRTHLLETHSDFATRYPEFWRTISGALDEGSDFGIVRPFF